MNVFAPAPATSPAFNNAEGQRTSYRGDIDGLRAIAVVSVVLYHAGFAPFSSGFVGVDIFFVISGYLIGGIILRETAEGRFSFARFYARRCRRILPALFVVVLATCAAGWVLLGARELRDVAVIGSLSLIGVSNINFWQFQDYFASDARFRVLLMTWSLGVEEQFYLFFPFLLIGTMRVARSRLGWVLGAVAVCSFVISVVWTWRSPAAAFYLLPSRAWELSAGVILAAHEADLILRSWPARWRHRHLEDGIALLGAGALLVSVVAFDDTRPFPGILALLPVAGTMLLLATRESRFNRLLLASRPLTAIGLVSYSWYLWHWPMMSLLRNILPNPSGSIEMGTTVAASFSLAVLSWRFVEQPFRRIRHAPGPTLIRYVIAATIVAAVPITIRIEGGFPSRLSEAAHALEASRLAALVQPCLIQKGSVPDPSPDCTVHRAGRSTVAVLGDSHAWALSFGIKELAKRDGLGYAIMVKAHCPPVLGIEVGSQTGLIAGCDAFNRTALQRITDDQTVTDVILAGFWSTYRVFNPGPTLHVSQTIADAALRTGLDAMILPLTRAGKHVILVQDTPAWPFDPHSWVLGAGMPVRYALIRLASARHKDGAIDSTPSDAIDRHDDLRNVLTTLAAQTPGVRVFDPLPAFCQANRCAFAEDGRLLFFDDNHVSLLGSERAVRDLRLNGP